MKIYINENKLQLLEGKDRKQQARAKTKKVIRNYFGEDNAMLDQPNNMTNGLTLVDFLEQEVMHDFFHSRSRADAKGYFVCLEPMVANIILHAGWQQDRPDNGTVARLEQILNYIEELYNKGVLDPRTVSLDSTIDDLNQQFGTDIDERNTKENNELNSKEFVQNENYTIIDNVDFGQANEIGNYSYSELPLCYTQDEDTWTDSFHGDTNKVYVCLVKDWKNIEEAHSESLLPQYPNSNAYDKYGLSMIFIFVNPEGELTFSNTRWNHEADYGDGRSVDHAFTKTDLSDLLGVNFNTRFIGYTEEELKKKGIRYVSFNNVQKLLDQGEDPEDIFYDFCVFEDGCALVSLDDKYNYINEYNKLLSPNQWFDDAMEFDNGFGQVEIGSRWNYINTDGILISDIWFKYAYSFDNGVAKVGLDSDCWNFINTEGQLLSKDEWFDDVGDFNEGSVRVYNNHKVNILKKNGQLISGRWFDDISARNNNSIYIVELNNRENLMKSDGSLVSEFWFDALYAGYLRYSYYCLVVLDYAYGVLNTMNGNVKWFNSRDEACDFLEKGIHENRKIIYVNKNKLSLLKENIENDLTSFIMDNIYSHQTSLSYTDMFPEVESEAYMYSILQKRFNEVKENLLKFEDIKSTNKDYLVTYLSHLITKAKELEKPIENNLIKCCENIITTIFDIPSETVIFDCKLVDKIEPKEGAIRLLPEEDENVDNFDFSQLLSYKNIKSLISKRRIINSLVQGGSYSLGTMFDIYNIDNENLIKLYQRIIAINDFILFTVKEKITDKNPKQGAYVEVILGRKGEKTEIHSQGIVFPLLVIETIRGFLELFASHGLPKDNELAKEVISHSDFLIAEPWDLRFGVGLWNMATHNIEKTNVLPYYFRNLCKLHNEEFKETFRGIVDNNHRLNDELINNAEREVEYNKFNDFMKQKNANFSVITDDIDNPEDLDKMELSEDYRQLSIPFDGNSWKYNYEYFIDYLESIGHYGTLPPNENDFYIENEIDDRDLLEAIDLSDGSDLHFSALKTYIVDYFNNLYDEDMEYNDKRYNDVQKIVEDFDNTLELANEQDMELLSNNGRYDKYALSDFLFKHLDKEILSTIDNDLIMDVFDRYYDALNNNENVDLSDLESYYTDDEIDVNDFYKSCLDISNDDESLQTTYREIIRNYITCGVDSLDFRQYFASKIKEYFIDYVGLNFDENGLLIIERGMELSEFLNKPDTLKNSLYKQAKGRYDGIGNCWAWMHGSGRSYCSGLNGGDNEESIVMIGKVNPNDVDWYSSCLLFYQFDEDEVRINHNTPIEIDEIYLDEYGDKRHLPLRKPIVVNSGTSY